MKSYFLSFVLIALLIASGCTPNHVVVNRTHVEKLTPNAPVSASGLDYALPRTVIDVEVIAEKTVTKPGPFADYAERYLGVTDVPAREMTEYRILDIRMKTHAERDPDQVFRIFPEGISPAGRVSLNPQGIIAGINLPGSLPEGRSRMLQNSQLAKKADEPGYPDLTIRKNTEPMLDTIYRVVRTDTSFMRLPLLKSQVSQKNLSNQAEEAANLIMKLRKRRFYMMAGEYSYRSDVRTPMPEGKALEVIVRELAQLEYDYVSLFVGRTITEKERFVFSYTPDGEGIAEADDLFVFSRFRGVLPAGNSNGDPVRILLNKTYDPMDMYSEDTDEAASGKDIVRRGIAYRIPGQAAVHLVLNNEKLAEEELIIAQYGVIQYLPAGLFNQVGTAILFHAEEGMIRQIFSK